jgi:peptidoglycan/xylan/chitin deacetylase (PgdA/CDA1 family)
MSATGGERRGAGVAWLAKRALFYSGLLTLVRQLHRRDRAVILRYHAITRGEDVPYAGPDICLPARALRLQMGFVRRAYRPVPLGDLVDALHGGGALPPRAVAITFDDGYADNFHLALPILRGLGIPATIYVATGGLEDGEPFWPAAARVLVLAACDEVRVPGLEPLSVGNGARRGTVVKALLRALVPLTPAERRDRLAAAAAAAGVDLRAALRGTMLTWAQIRELATAGWTIGAHTVTHGNVALMPAAEAEREIAESRDALTTASGDPVRHFCYPNTGGKHRYYSEEVASTLRRLGFRSGTISGSAGVGRGASPYLIPRLGVSPRLAPVVELAAAMERGRLAR